MRLKSIQSVDVHRMRLRELAIHAIPFTQHGRVLNLDAIQYTIAHTMITEFPASGQQVDRNIKRLM